MPHVHFIAIGGAAMHSLAIALSEDPAYRVTGSDDEIFEPSRSRLQAHGLLPAETGWHPERIDGSIDAVVVGMHATADNPELRRARELGLRIYSFPEYLYEHTRGKKRVVVGGSHGKTTTTAMILHVLHRAGIEADYMVGAQIEGLDNMVRLSADARVAVFEGDEYLTSPLDPRPKFHLYKPHVAVLTGIAWDHINVFPTFDCYVEQFRRFAELIEPHGCLIYYEGDENLRRIAAGLRPDITALPYGTPAYEVREGTTCLLTGDGEVALQVFGEHNLQNIEAARLACGRVHEQRLPEKQGGCFPSFAVGALACRLQRRAGRRLRHAADGQHRNGGRRFRQGGHRRIFPRLPGARAGARLERLRGAGNRFTRLGKRHDERPGKSRLHSAEQSLHGEDHRRGHRSRVRQERRGASGLRPDALPPREQCNALARRACRERRAGGRNLSGTGRRPHFCGAH